jgi:hypothetical protein
VALITTDLLPIMCPQLQYGKDNECAHAQCRFRNRFCAGQGVAFSGLRSSQSRIFNNGCATAWRIWEFQVREIAKTVSVGSISGWTYFILLTEAFMNQFISFQLLFLLNNASNFFISTVPVAHAIRRQMTFRAIVCHPYPGPSACMWDYQKIDRSPHTSASECFYWPNKIFPCTNASN